MCVIPLLVLPDSAFNFLVSSYMCIPVIISFEIGEIGIFSFSVKITNNYAWLSVEINLGRAKILEGCACNQSSAQAVVFKMKYKHEIG